MIKSFAFIFLLLSFFSCDEKRSDKAGEKMQQFVINISNYSRQHDSDFIIIPQNGVELAFSSLEPADGLNASYLNAIDGFGIEELFYYEVANTDQEILSMCQTVQPLKPVLVADYVKDNADIAVSIQKNSDEGFLSFPRAHNNYDYVLIPDFVTNENAADITALAEAKNYLYLISTNNYSSKEEMLMALESTNYDVVLIDLFFEDEAFTANEITRLKVKANGGKRLLISYINVGAAENYRYYWKGSWKLHHPDWLKKKYDGYVDEIWVEFWNDEWKSIIYGNDNSYIKKIINAGFDGAYLDNVEGYYSLYFD
jgi:cysteinyl-tRNA synthetase, unknown class